MQKLANISVFESLQNQANRQALSQMSVFNGEAGFSFPGDPCSAIRKIYRAVNDAVGDLMDYIDDGLESSGALSGDDYEGTC